MAEPIPFETGAQPPEPQRRPNGEGLQTAAEPCPGWAELSGSIEPCVLDQPVASPLRPDQGLTIRSGADGSFSLWSEAFGEGFHSGRGALREAHETFLQPSQLERFRPGCTVRVLEVCVGTGCNLAALLQACGARGLRLDWIGLELDPEPLRLALSQPAFRDPWQPGTLAILETLLDCGAWNGTADSCRDRRVSVLGMDSSGFAESGEAEGASSRGRLLWGDARQTLASLGTHHTGKLDLIWHDAFSPQRCPQLWSVELLRRLSALLKPEGRWISYCSAAAVREGLRLADLQLAALHTPEDGNSSPKSWSGGTVASPRPLGSSPLWRLLTPMEREHLASSAGEPYRDPCGNATAAEILVNRQRAQAEALANGSRGSSGVWRRRWGVER